jgi:hypothetical protein
MSTNVTIRQIQNMNFKLYIWKTVLDISKETCQIHI